jgi:predicted amidophosphoribosyltransferase
MTHQWIKSEGNWRAGYAYDFHTTNSIYLGQDEYGHDKYENTRSEMGELIYQLKYRNNHAVLSKIVDLLQVANYSMMDVVIPIPPSKERVSQPVLLIANELGNRLNIPVYGDFLAKTNGSEELKGMEQEKRIDALKSTIYIKNNADFSGKVALLIDDLYRSGSTLRVATDLLYEKANVKDVYVLTATKTRSNQ